MEFPTIDEIAKEVAEKAFDEFTYEGKTIREWAEVISKQQPSENVEVIQVSKGALKSRQGRFVIYDAEWLKNNFYLEETLYGQPKQSKMGKWIKRDSWSEGFGMGEKYGYYYECSECGKQVKGGYPECNYNYCPYCGSDNREEADE